MRHDSLDSPSPNPLSLEEVGSLLEFIDRLDAAEVELTLGDLHLVVRKRSSDSTAHVRPPGATAPPLRLPVEPTNRLALDDVEPDTELGSAASDSMRAWLDQEAAGRVLIVRSPMVGLFYRAKEPGAPPFVEVGSAVDPNTVVCLVEVMKLFHSVPAGANGLVEMFFVSDASTVEYMQPLLAILKS